MKLTELALKTIEDFFNHSKFEPDEKTKKKFSKIQASFVTLTIKGELRGCIGSIYPICPLWQDVRKNAINAAFNDPRFPPLTKEELHRLTIEVSVLSPLKKINFKSPQELLKKINTKMGIYLKKNFHSATFLPQVWKEIPDKLEFMEYLSMKAGLSKDAWKTAEIFYYTVKSEKTE